MNLVVTGLGGKCIGNLKELKNIDALNTDELRALVHSLGAKLNKCKELFAFNSKLAGLVMISDLTGQQLIFDKLLTLSKPDLLTVGNDINSIYDELVKEVDGFVGPWWRYGNRAASMGGNYFNNNIKNYQGRNARKSGWNGGSRVMNGGSNADRHYGGNFDLVLFKRCKSLGVCYRYQTSECVLDSCKFDHKYIASKNHDTTVLKGDTGKESGKGKDIKK